VDFRFIAIRKLERLRNAPAPATRFD